MYLPAFSPSTSVKPNAPTLEVIRAYLEANAHEADSLNQLIEQLTDEGEASISGRKNMRGHITSSMCVVNPEGTHILMIHHKAHGRWLAPGGHYEPEISLPGAPLDLRSSAERETAEETGFKCLIPLYLHPRLDIPMDINTHPIASRKSKQEGPHFHHDFMYLAKLSQRAAVESLPMQGMVVENGINMRWSCDEVDGLMWRKIESLSGDMDHRNRVLGVKLKAYGFR